MKRLRLWLGIAVLVFLLWFFVITSGVLDSGKFEILQSKAVSTNRIAMLVARSDNYALSGIEYFVVIADHPYSGKELSRVFHTFFCRQRVFEAGRPVVIHAVPPNQLIIECDGCGLTKDLIETQRFSYDGITIRYVGFP